MAPGGSHINPWTGDASYSEPTHYSPEFYTGLRWSVIIVGGVMAVTSYCWNYRIHSIVFGSTCILFNPIIPIHMSKEWWAFFDMVAFWIFVTGPGFLWPKPSDACL